MKRTFNYTGRRKIGRKDVSIKLRQEQSVWVFDADLRLGEHQFPRNAEVWMEAHRQNLWMQWAWGTVSAPRVPADRRLTEFDVPDGVLFRVRVVQPPGPEHHKLVGEADAIPFVKAGEVDDRRPLQPGPHPGRAAGRSAAGHERRHPLLAAAGPGCLRPGRSAAPDSCRR